MTMFLKVAFLVAAFLMAISSVGAKEDRVGDRCLILAGVFTAATILVEMYT